MSNYKTEFIKPRMLCDTCMHHHVCAYKPSSFIMDTIDKTVYSCGFYNRAVKTTFYLPKIKNVLFNEPATIVMWENGDKTVVKCQDGDTFDPEKGLAMAITKYVMGNKGAYNNEINRWVAGYYENIEENIIQFGIPTIASKILEGFAAGIKNGSANPIKVEKMFKGE